MRRVRIILRLTALILLLSASILLHILVQLFTRRSAVPKYFLRCAGWIMGARTQITGQAPEGQYFIISNHISWLDIFLLGGATGTAFIGKAELGKTPFVAWLCSLNRTVYVDRSNKFAIAEQITQVGESLGQGYPITLFPEGTTGDGAALLPFKTSILRALEGAPRGLIAQPVYLDYGPDVRELCWVGDESGIDNGLGILARRGTFPVHIHFLPPFDPAECDGRKGIGAAAEAVISAAHERAIASKN